MTQQLTAGARLRLAIREEQPLQIIGTVNAYAAMMAKRTGFRAIYLSGAGVANYSYGLPDLGMTSLDDVLIDARRITSQVDLPLLVDADTGWGGAFNIARTVKQMTAAGVAGMHIEDQVSQKRCGHRPNKEVVSTDEMVDRVKAAVDAKTDADFVVMARTDALQVEGLNGVIDRLQKLVPAEGTSLANAFEVASRMTPPPDNIYLITDGLPTQGAAPGGSARVSGRDRQKLFNQALDKLPRGIPVNVILAPMEGDPMAASALWQLAVSTRGSFLAPARDWP